MNDTNSEERSENVSCIFCAGLALALIATIPIMVFLHLSVQEGVILFLGTIVVAFVLLYVYDRRALSKVIDMISE